MERSGIQESKTPPDFGASRLHPGYSLAEAPAARDAP
jgi:hypothetical protein